MTFGSSYGTVLRDIRVCLKRTKHNARRGEIFRSWGNQSSKKKSFHPE